MSDLIRREDAMQVAFLYPFFSDALIEEIKAIPSADTDLSEYSDKLWKNAYERGKADGAMIYGNEHNCIMTIFGECSYAETGCGDCAVVEKVRKALSADRPQAEWIFHYRDKWMVKAECPKCHRRFKFSPRAIWKCCPMCETRMKGVSNEADSDKSK